MYGNSSIKARDLLTSLRKQLEVAYSPKESRQLALILLDNFAGIDTKEMIINPDLILDKSIYEPINQSVLRLLKHEPIQYITGIAHFCGYEFRVNPDVLIPRPETEELVRWILEDYAGRHQLMIADIGTGSGCIAISLWLRFQDAEVHAFDLSEPALKVAAQNNDELGSQVKFMKMNFLNRDEWPNEKFDIVVSNPPYIPLKNIDLLPKNVSRFEPAPALFVPDQDPLIFYTALVDFANSRLNNQEKLFVEVHEHFADDVLNLFESRGFNDVKIRLDINGKKRMVRASKKV